MLPLDVEWLGRVPYAAGLALQEQALADRRRGATPDRLLLLEHPPVVTLGRSSRPENLLVPREQLAARGIECFEIPRGGDVTYHAPGQLVGYLVVDLDGPRERDLHRFLRGVEAGLIAALGTLGVPARRIAGWTGVFVDDPAARPRKIASIGIGLRNWVTWHGFALNVSMDLSGFETIVPCGLQDVEMSSVARERGEARDALPALDARARAAVRDAFQSAAAADAA